MVWMLLKAKAFSVSHVIPQFQLTVLSTAIRSPVSCLSLFSLPTSLLSQDMHIIFSPFLKLLQILGRPPWGGDTLAQKKCKTEIHIIPASSWEYALVPLARQWPGTYIYEICITLS